MGYQRPTASLFARVRACARMSLIASLVLGGAALPGFADRTSRLADARALAAAPQSGASADQAHAALRRETDPEVKAILVGALGRHRPDVSILPDLQAAAQDPSPAVRLEAAAALGRLQAPAAVAALAGLLSDPNADVRQMAAMRLRAHESDTAIEALAAAASADVSAAVRAEAVRTLGTFKAVKAKDAVKKAGSDKDAEVRRAAQGA